MTGPSLLERLERYYDAVPRSNARAEDFGPLTLFVTEGPGWPYYGRPTLGAEGTADDVARVMDRQREIGVPESIEWVAETSPWLEAAATQAGLAVHVHPLLVLDPKAWWPSPVPEGIQVRRLEADDPDLEAAQAISVLAFANPGTAVGEAGRDQAPAENEDKNVQARKRIRAGLTVTYIASDGDGPLCVGSHQPLDGVTEVVGVGTVPAARRRGLGAAVTSALVADALEHDVDLVFLSAEGEAVARIYARLGFVQVAKALVAERVTP